jgi:hypothetical protein
MLLFGEDGFGFTNEEITGPGLRVIFWVERQEISSSERSWRRSRMSIQAEDTEPENHAIPGPKIHPE